MPSRTLELSVHETSSMVSPQVTSQAPLACLAIRPVLSVTVLPSISNEASWPLVLVSVCTSCPSIFKFSNVFINARAALQPRLGGCCSRATLGRQPKPQAQNRRALSPPELLNV